MTPAPDRRSDVLRIAAELFARKGISGTSMRDLGEATKLHAGSLYHYFRSKEELVGIIVAHLFRDAQAALAPAAAAPGTPTERIHRLIAATLALIDSHPNATRVYQQDQRYLRDHGMLDDTAGSAEALSELWLDALRAGVAEGDFRDDLPVAVLHQTIRDTLWGSARWTDREQFSLPEFTDMLIRLLMRAIAAE